MTGTPTVCLWYVYNPNPEARGRVLQAMIGMKKIDITAIDSARKG